MTKSRRFLVLDEKVLNVRVKRLLISPMFLRKDSFGCKASKPFRVWFIVQLNSSSRPLIRLLQKGHSIITFSGIVLEY